jgi:hypothetical protein
VNLVGLAVEAETFICDFDAYNDDLLYWSPDYPGLLLICYSPDTNDSRFGRAEHTCQVA